MAIEVKTTTRNPRSTVGTSTEIYDYLKLLFARIGKTFSPISGQEVKKDTDLDNNSSRIKGYTYSIVFKDITFNKPGGPQTEKKFPFGDFTTTIDALPLTFNPSNANQCSVTKQIYNFNDKASLTIDNIDPSLIVNKVTPPNEPRTGLINDITNKLFYRVFSGAPVDADYFCKTIPPANPSITQIWAGVNGKIDDDSGIIEVTTTTNAITLLGWKPKRHK